jgi:hypothetical protein
VINRAIVDQCDLVLGIFWARIGSPTGTADSGTLEEIERAAAAGKPAMLYFSKAGTDPEELDLEQVAKLNAFKKRIRTTALHETYKSLVDFRDKLARQLEIKVRDLQKEDTLGQPPPLQLRLAGPDSDKLDSALTFKLTRPDLNNREYGMVSANERQEIDREVDRRLSKAVTIPVVLAISNTGASGIRSLFVEVAISCKTGQAIITDAMRVSNYTFTVQAKGDWVNQPYLTETSDGWCFSFEWDAIQPQRTRAIHPQLFVTAQTTCEIGFSARVYADNFAQPMQLVARLNATVDVRPVTMFEIMPDLDEVRKEAKATTGPFSATRMYLTEAAKGIAGFDWSNLTSSEPSVSKHRR